MFEIKAYQIKRDLLFEWFKAKKFILFPLLTLGTVFLVYQVYSIKVHTWESYYYAGSINHFIPVSDMAPPGHNLSLPYNDLICIYYTQHPMLYFMVYFIHNCLFSGINPLFITQYINIILGILGLLGIYLILKKIFNDTKLSCQGVLLISCLDVYWYQSLSAEVYIGAFSFLSLSMYALLVRNDKNIKNTSFICMCICFGIAFCFHLYALFFGFVIAVDIIKRSRNLIFCFRQLLVLISISAIFFLSAYVIPYFLLTSISNFSELNTLLFIHSKIWGIWQIPEYLMPVEILYSIGIGFKHVLYAVVSGNNFLSNLTRFLFGLLIFIHIIGYIIKPDKNRVSDLCLIWLGVYFITLTSLIHVPSVNDNWCLCIFPLILFLMYRYRYQLKTQKGKLALWAIIGFLFFINGTTDIFPKTKVSEKQFFIARDLKNNLANYSKILFMGNHNILTQAWFIFYQKDFNSPCLSYLHPPYEYPSVPQYQKDLLQRVSSVLEDHKALLLLSSENSQSIRLTINLLRSSGYSIQPVFQKDLTIDPKTYKVSLGIIKKQIQLRYVAYRITKSNGIKH